MRNSISFICIYLFAYILLPNPGFSQSKFTENWSACYQNNSYTTVMNDMTADSAGNVYATGYFINNTGGKKFFATKTNKQGVQQWVRFYPVDEPDTSQMGMHVVADNKGNVWFIGKRFDIETSPCTTYARRSVFCICYNQSGKLIYSNTVSEPQDYGDLLVSVCNDNNENLYLAIFVENCYAHYSKIIKLDKTGSIKWENSFFIQPYFVNDVAVDNNGAIIITGELLSPPLSARSDNVNELFIKKLDAKKGEVIWENSFEGINMHSSSRGYNVAVNQLNDIYVYGVINDTASLFKYNASGKLAWYKREKFIPIKETNKALAIDEKNNAYILSNLSQYSIHHNQWMISKYTPNGKKDWSFVFDTTATDIKLPAAIIYANGNIYTTGTSYINGRDRYTTIQLNKDGKQKGVYFYGRKSEQSEAVCLSANATGNVYIGGNAGERTCIVKLGDNVYDNLTSFLH